MIVPRRRARSNGSTSLLWRDVIAAFTCAAICRAAVPRFGLGQRPLNKKSGCDAAGFSAVRIGLMVSAGRLAAPGDADLFLQIVDADRADHDLLADHAARRAVHAHGLSELEVLFQRIAHFGARQVLLELAHVEADFLGDSHGARLVGPSAGPPRALACGPHVFY